MFDKLKSILRKPPQDIPNRTSIEVKEALPTDTKAFIQDTAVNQWQFIYGQSSTKYYTPKQLLTYNTGWVYTCNNKNAQTLATIPLKLYYKKNGKEIKATPHKNISTQQKKFLKETVRKDVGEDVVEITEHPLMELLEHPNERMNWTDFVYQIQTYCGLIGNSYVYVERDKEGKPIHLYPLLAENVSVICKDNGWGYGEITQYKYTNTLNNQGRTEDRITMFNAEDIIHFLNPAPGNTLYGKGELEACLSAAERDFYYDQVENSLNKNNARPDFLISYKGGIKESEIKEVQRMWYKKYGTPLNAGKPLVAGGDIDVKQLGFSPRDMQYEKGREECRRIICATYGVPNSLVDINSANLASSKMGQDYYIMNCIKPKLIRFLEKLNEQLVELYDENLFLWFDGDLLISSDPKETAEIDKIYLDQGIYGAQFVRGRLGIELEQPDAEKATPTAMRVSETDNANPQKAKDKIEANTEQKPKEAVLNEED